ncbi:MAG: hypothetical protein SFV19_02920 [Rhodospirillaceae bacterium]|nr:hypothetical protein [Rhodospirillaceae bacterium]
MKPAGNAVALGAPHFDGPGLKAFEQYVGTAQVYLEYGCGGSTLLAAKLGAKTIISAETDPKWAEAVRAGLQGAAAVIEVLHCDVGEVGDWGVPKDKSGLARYHTYATTPWDAARRGQIAPDVVLIDGRFRVACFLYSLMCARPGAIILFDDYAERAQYHIVEQFCPRERLHGRMAEFRAPGATVSPDLAKAFAQHSIVVD